MKATHPGFSTWNSQILFHPWIYFSIFLVSNTLLSYVPLSFSAKLWIAMMGVALPFGLGLWDVFGKYIKQPRFTSSGIKPSFSNSSFSNIPFFWLWSLFLSLLFFTRFFKLTTIPFWPISDEGISSYLGMAQSFHWQWKLLWTEGQMEPFFIWILGLYFKIISPSLFSIRFFPAILSIITCITAYWAVRAFFPRFFSIVFTFFFSFSFWQFMLSRSCMPIILAIFLQCLCLGFAGRFIRSFSHSSRMKYIWILFFCAGIGFYSVPSWAAIWLYLFLVFLVPMHAKESGGWGFITAFLSLTFLMVMPLFFARLSPGGMTYILQLVNFNIFDSLISYFIVIFWDGTSGFPFSSNCGGILNSLLGSLVFVGFLDSFQKKGFFWNAIVAGVFITMLPGILAKGIEPHRILNVIPFLMIWATAGLQSLLSLRYMKINLAIVSFLLLASFCCDALNFIYCYSNIKSVPQKIQWRSVPYAHAYQILKHQVDLTGPIYLFSEFNMDYDNKTLNVAGYPFDVLQNQRLNRNKVIFSALLVKMDYAHYLLSVFPGTSVNILPNNAVNEKVLQMGLFLVPINQLSEKTLQTWADADRVCRKINLLTKNKNPVQSWSIFADMFLMNKSTFKTDPFLITVFWEKVAFFYYLGADFRKASEAYEMAIRQGLEVAHLYQNYGLCLKLIGENQKAEKAFEKAREISSRVQ